MKTRVSVVALALLTACAGSLFSLHSPADAAVPPQNGGSPNAAVTQLVMDAQKAIKAGKLSLAVIDLKNASSADPHNGQVRAQLGVVLLQTGNSYEAERELRQARKDGASDSMVLPSLFAAMILRKEEKTLLDEFPEPSSPVNMTPVILNARALAFLNLGQLTDATGEINKSLALRRDLAGLLLGARIAAKTGDLSSALQYTNEAIAVAPNKPDAALAKIGLLLQSKDLNGALVLANQLVTKFPTDFAAQFARVDVLMLLRKDDQAKAAVDAMLAKNPNMPIAIYDRALLMYRAGDYKAAWRTAQVLPQEFFQLQPGVAVMTSQMAERSGNLETAAAILNAAIARYPQNAELRARLAAMRVRQNDINGAINALEPLRDKIDPAGAQMLAALYVKSNKASQAEGVLEKLIQSGAGTDATVLQLVALERQLGRPDQALKDLTAAVNRKPTDVVLVNQLVIALTSRGRFAEALSVASKLADDPGQRLASFLLQGQVLMGQHRVDDALMAYAKATQIDPANQAALYNHAAVLESLQRFSDAEKDLHAIVRLNPKSTAAYLRLAEIAARQKQDRDVRSMLSQAIKMSPQDTAPRFALARYLASRKDLPGTLNAVNDLLKLYPKNEEGLAMLGSIQLSMGKKADAVATLRRLAELAPRAPGFQILLGNALFANGDRSGANAALKTAVNLAATSPQVRLAQINMLFEEKDSDSAIRAAQAYEASNPGPQGDLLLGDTLARAGRRDQAMTIYRTSFAAHPNNGLVLRMAANSVALGDKKSAAEVLSDWVSKNPEDTSVRVAYGMFLMQQGNNSDAVREFREVLRKDPDNVASLNNLAWLRSDQDPKEAFTLASRAVALAPNSSEVLDTLGWINLEHGKSADSLALFKRAHELRPRDGEISYHLALSLNATGSRDAARGLLRALLSSKVGFADLADANKLAQTWH